jgi:hypothetical protein
MSGRVYLAGAMISVALNIGIVVLRITAVESSIGLASGNVAYHICLFIFINAFKKEICLFMAEAEMIADLKPRIVTMTKVSKVNTLYRLS